MRVRVLGGSSVKEHDLYADSGYRHCCSIIRGAGDRRWTAAVGGVEACTVWAIGAQQSPDADDIGGLAKCLLTALDNSQVSVKSARYSART